MRIREYQTTKGKKSTRARKKRYARKWKIDSKGKRVEKKGKLGVNCWVTLINGR